MSSIRDPVFGCELVEGHLTPDGYARVGKTLGHLAAWLAARGPVPSGKVIDHGCQRRNCRALHHLEAVTPRENLLRRRFAYRLKLARCPAGHDLQLNRQVTPEGGITCRRCRDEAVARWGANRSQMQSPCESNDPGGMFHPGTPRSTVRAGEALTDPQNHKKESDVR